MAMDAKASHFELAPPRRFILPAILLLLSEAPRHGYGLLPVLREFGFGHVDRPAVYRALAQLERDGMVTAPPAESTTGRARRVYRITRYGEQVLRSWMCVIMEEHDRLERVLRRYQATGTTDAVLADVEGRWWTSLGTGWSPVSPTADNRWRLVPSTVNGAGRNGGAGADRHGSRNGSEGAGRDRDGAGFAGAEPSGTRSRGVPSPIQRTAGRAGVIRRGEAVPRGQFRLNPDRSAILIEARSTVGPLSFGAVGLTGMIEAGVVDGELCGDAVAEGRLSIDVDTLSSGNDLYDAELRRRIDARRYPTVAVHLSGCTPGGSAGRYRLAGDITFHGLTRAAEGTVEVRSLGDGRMVITGEQVFDIRDFAIPSPTVLMLRIYPDIRVRLHAEATWKELA